MHALFASKWLPEPGDVRTTRKIKIPYNPLILQKKKKPKPARRKPHNAFLKAKQYEKLLQRKKVKNKTELAQRQGISRARVTQILNLLKLAPEIREYLESLTDEKQLRYYTERRLRPITVTKGHKSQMEKFDKLKRRADSTRRIISPNRL